MRHNTQKYNVTKTLQNLFEVDATPERRSVVLAMESTEEEPAPPEHEDELLKWGDLYNFAAHIMEPGIEEKYLPISFINAGELVLIPFVKLSQKEKEAVLTKAEKLHFRMWGYRSQNIFILNERPTKIRQIV